MSYVQGFVIAVPTANREAFRAYATAAARGFKELGALAVVECWGEDVPDGEVTSFRMAVQARPDETVVFAWAVWPSKAVCDDAMSRSSAYTHFDRRTNPLPFDGERMMHGCFVPIVEA